MPNNNKTNDKESQQPPADTYTVVSGKNQRVKFYVEKHHDNQPGGHTQSGEQQQQQQSQLPSSSADRLVSLFQQNNSNGKSLEFLILILLSFFTFYLR